MNMIKRYSGDGTITKVRTVLQSGFQIDFQSFRLDQIYEARYRLDGLPRLERLYRVGLVPDVQQEDSDQDPHILMSSNTGLIKLVLDTTSGRKIFEASSTLQDLNWIWIRGARFGEINPSTQTAKEQVSQISFEDVLTNDPLRLTVIFHPGKDPKRVTARVRLTAGGVK
jgi:hypothetical protein